MTESPDVAPHAYLLIAGEAAERQGLALAESLRDRIKDLRLLVNCGAGSFKSQMKRADKSGARLVLILGEDEVQQQTIVIKDLREDQPQRTVPQQGIDSILRGFIA